MVSPAGVFLCYYVYVSQSMFRAMWVTLSVIVCYWTRFAVSSNRGASVLLVALSGLQYMCGWRVCCYGHGCLSRPEPLCGAQGMSGIAP